MSDLNGARRRVRAASRILFPCASSPPNVRVWTPNPIDFTVRGVFAVVITAGLFLSGCASGPTAMRINGDVIARGTPVVVIGVRTLDDREKIALDRELGRFGFVPVQNVISPYAVMVSYESAGTVAVIELLKNGVPLLVARSGSDWYIGRRIADFRLVNPELPPAEFYQARAAFFTALSGFEKAWYHYSSPVAKGFPQVGTS